MNRTIIKFGTVLTVAIIVLGDQILKTVALQRFPLEETLIDPGMFTLAIHKNTGLAFNIPFHMTLTIVISILIGLALLYTAYKNWKKHPSVALAAITIVLGASGNLYDRIVYGFTVDYLIFFGRSAINISDLVILFGVVWLLLASRNEPEESLFVRKPAN